VWAIYLQFNTDSDSLRRMNCELVSQYLKGNRGIEAFAFSSANLSSSSSCCWTFLSHSIGSILRRRKEYSQLKSSDIN
jgi:hypothetical protein